MTPAPSHLTDLLRRYARRPWLWIEPGGNWGDELIYRGAYALARRLGRKQLPRVTAKAFVRRPRRPSKTVLYIHGSGGCVPFWSGWPLQALRKALQTHRGPVILGPSTWWPEPDWLASQLAGLAPRCERIVLMARERTSYEALAASPAARLANLLLEPDTALALTRRDLGLAAPARWEGQLLALRADQESAGGPRRPRAIDPVVVGSFAAWVRLHDRHAALVTDRLHSAILATILRLPCTLLPGRYHKNRSLWEFSLAERGVAWSENADLVDWLYKSAKMPQAGPP